MGLLLKGRVTAPLHWQNMQMYIHGVWLNFAFMMMYDGAVIRSAGVFHGYTWVTWAAIICNAIICDAGRDAGVSAAFWLGLDGTADHRLASSDCLDVAVQHTDRVRRKVRPDRGGGAEDRLTRDWSRAVPSRV